MQGAEFSIRQALDDRKTRRADRARRRRRALVQTLAGVFGFTALAAASLVPDQPPPGAGEQPRAQWVNLRNPPPVPQPPEALAAYVDALGRNFQGRAGIAVRSLEGGWTAAHDAEGLYPQQSVSKLWVALSVLDAVDRQVIRLDDPVLVRRQDLSIFHQPIRDFVGPRGFATSVDELLESATTKSDNAANDVLMRLVGGPEAVRAVIAEKELGAIGLADEERYFQTQIAGLEWREQFSFGRTFWRARSAMPQAERRAALEAYLAEPPDGATPVAVVEALERLHRGELLSPESTELLLTHLGASRTGPNRLGGGLAEGWTLAHKTGTGQVMGPLATGYNDVGLLTAPDGATYAVAVMIAETTATIPERQALMQAVTRAVIASHDGLDPAAPPSDDFEFTPYAADQETAELDLRPKLSRR